MGSTITDERFRIGRCAPLRYCPKRLKLNRSIRINFSRAQQLRLRKGIATHTMTTLLNEDGAIALADSLPDAVFLVDETGEIRYANTVCEEVLGYRQSDLVGQPMLELVVPADREETLHEANRVLAGKKRVGFENRYRHRNGADVHLSWSAQWHPAHQLRIGVARDVTAPRHGPVVLPQRPDHLNGLDALAPHERRVLNLLLTEAGEKQIAERLGLAVSTTHSYVTAIYRKFGVHGRAGLMSLWLRHVVRD